MTAHRNPLEPRKRPRQRRSEETRDRILDAAVEVFTEYGYVRGTTNRIAEWAEISVGSLYQYYPNKDAIVAELVARHLEAGSASIDATSDSIDGLVRAIVTASIDNHRHAPEYLRVLIEQAAFSSEVMARVGQLQRAAIDDMRALLESRPDVAVRNTEAAARLIVNTVDIAVHLMLAAPDPLDAEVVEAEVVAMLTGYLAGSRPGE